MGGGGGSPKAPPNTSQEKAQAEIAMQRYKHYMDNYRPLENVAIGDIMSDRAANRVEGWAGGQLNADAAQTMAANSGGFDPSGQQAQMEMMNPQRAAIIAQTAAEQSGLGRKQKMSGLDTAIAIGSGQAKEAQMGFADLAGQSLNRSIRQQEASFNSRANRADTYGSLAGAAIRGGEHVYNNYTGNS